MGGCAACGLLVDTARTPSGPTGDPNEMDADIGEFIDCPPDAAADAEMDATEGADAIVDAEPDAMVDAEPDATPDS